jgi:hypothetical protein
VAYALKPEPNLSYDKFTKTTAFDCTDMNTNQFVVSLLDQGECKKTTRNSSTSIVSVQVIQSMEYESRPVIQCLLSYDITINYCGGFFDGRNSFVKKYNFINEISHHICGDIIKTEFYADPRNSRVNVKLKNGHGTFRGYIAGSVTGVDCTGAEFLDHMNEFHKQAYVYAEIKIIAQKAKADLKLNDNSLFLESGTKCRFSEGSCFDQVHGQTFWDIGVSGEDCGMQSLYVIYSGLVNKTVEYGINYEEKISYFSLDNNQIFFIEARSEILICGFSGYSSQHPRIFVTEVMHKHYQFFEDKNRSIRDIDILILGGMQLSLLYNNIAVQITKMYDNILYHKCISDSKLISTTLSLAKLDPTSLGLSLFGQPGFFTKIAGEVAYIVKCRPVEVEVRKSKTCYNEIPITYNNISAFMSPRSRLVVPEGTIVDCEDFFPPIYKIGASWYSLNHGRLTAVSAPIDMEISKVEDWAFVPIKNLASKGIYSPEDIAIYKESINRPMSREAKSLNVMNALNDRSDRPTDSFVVKDFMKRVKDELFDGPFAYLKSQFYALGNTVSGIMGLFIIFKAMKFIINMIFNAFLIQNIFGWTWKVLFSFWDSVTHFMIRRHDNKQTLMRKDNIYEIPMKIIENDKEQENIPDDDVFVEPVVPEYHQIRDI